MSPKRRVTVSVDQELLEAARAAVERGDVRNISAWVNEGMQRQLDHERRLGAADDFFAWYEAEHGPITEEQMDEAERIMAERSIRVRGRGSFVPELDDPDREPTERKPR